jgi:hypothetical protein
LITFCLVAEKLEQEASKILVARAKRDRKDNQLCVLHPRSDRWHFFSQKESSDSSLAVEKSGNYRTH